jgi:HAD domain in Swiss Army Knife RNA repair proteins
VRRSPATPSTPLLLVDIDGVISLFGRPPGASQTPAAGDGPPIDGSFHSIEGMPHFLSSTAAAHLLSLAPLYELVWASGWEERAEEHLPHLLGVPERLPFLRFPRDGAVAGAAADGAGAGPQTTLAHWKLQSVDAYAADRPLAWIDDAFNDACHDWAAARAAPTLLVATDPQQGLTSQEARLLEDWARALRAG